MSRAVQVCYSSFDDVFLRLPPDVRQRIEASIDDMGSRLGSFPHYRMTGGNRYRLRAGDYRVIYTFDLRLNEIHLLAVGHRREIYR
jgi:mRNA-degrading endonuclease RelE of RelBE toxin-antitoxin system